MASRRLHRIASYPATLVENVKWLTLWHSVRNVGPASNASELIELQSQRRTESSRFSNIPVSRAGRSSSTTCYALQDVGPGVFKVMDPSFVFGLAIMIQFLGIISLFAVRCCRQEMRPLWNSLFFTLLLLVGAITLVSIMVESGHWLVSGSILSLMVVGAVISNPSSVVSSPI